MPSSPSPRSTPAPDASPRSGPVNPSILPDRSIPSAPLDQNSKPSFVPAWRRPTLQMDGDSSRRPSVQFVPQIKTDGAQSSGASRSSSAQPPISRPKLGSVAFGPGTGPGGRRLSSPPPPAQFRSSVSFDTFNNKEASDFSLTLNRKHRDYEYTKRSRTFLCGTDTNDYSDTALEWLIDELVDDGDEIVCLRVVEKDSREAIKWSGGMGEKGYRREAQKFLDAIEKKNSEDRAISLILEFAIGKVHDTIQHMIRLYEPAMLVVGTRGKSLTGYQGLLSSGSVSKYCLQYSPVPVIVVRPSSKREAKKRKRLRDPSRTGYRDILDKSDEAPRGRGMHLLDPQNRTSFGSADMGALGQLDAAHDPDHEARMVAEAIGYRGAPAAAARPASREGVRSSSLSRTVSARSADSDNLASPDEQVLKSPNLQGAPDSPPLPSDDEDDVDDYEDDGGVMRPEDEAAMLAYQRAQKVFEEEKEEAEARAKRGNSRGPRSKSRDRRGGDDEEGAGAGVLGVLAQLDRGIIK